MKGDRDEERDSERQKKREKEEKRSEKQGCNKLPLVVLEVLLLAAVNFLLPYRPIILLITRSLSSY